MLPHATKIRSWPHSALRMRALTRLSSYWDNSFEMRLSGPKEITSVQCGHAAEIPNNELRTWQKATQLCHRHQQRNTSQRYSDKVCWYEESAWAFNRQHPISDVVWVALLGRRREKRVQDRGLDDKKRSSLSDVVHDRANTRLLNMWGLFFKLTICVEAYIAYISKAVFSSLYVGTKCSDMNWVWRKVSRK